MIFLVPSAPSEDNISAAPPEVIAVYVYFGLPQNRNK